MAALMRGDRQPPACGAAASSAGRPANEARSLYSVCELSSAKPSFCLASVWKYRCLLCVKLLPPCLINFLLFSIGFFPVGLLPVPSACDGADGEAKMSWRYLRHSPLTPHLHPR